MSHDQFKAQLAQLDQEEATTRSALAGAEQDCDRARLALMRDAKNKAKTAQVADHEKEIDGYREALARIAGARRALIAEHEADTEQARAAALDQYKADALTAAKMRLAAAAKVKKALEAFGDALADYASAGAATWASVSRCTPLHGRGVESTMELFDVANGRSGAIVCALNTQMRRVEALGSKLPHAVQFPGLVSGVHGDIVESAQQEVETVQATLKTWTTPASKEA